MTTPSRLKRRRKTVPPLLSRPTTLQLFLPRSIPNAAICMAPIPVPPVTLNHVVANLLIVHTVVGMTRALDEIAAQGHGAANTQRPSPAQALT